MLLTARRLFTGRTTDVLDDQVLDIDDGRIVDIRHRRSVPPGTDLVDLGEVTLAVFARGDMAPDVEARLGRS